MERELQPYPGCGEHVPVAERVDRLFGLPDPPTALIVYSDDFAMQAIQALQSRGLRVPGDVSVIGHNDSPWAHRFAPAISSIGVPFNQMAFRAVKRLLERIREPELAARTELLPESLSVRETTGPAPRGGPNG